MKAFEIFIPVVIVGGIALSQSCCPKHYPTIVYRDSVRVEIRERIVHDTVSFEVPVIKEVNVTKDTSSHLENDWAKSDAEMKDGFLWHSLETKGKTVYIPVTTVVHDTVIVEKEAHEITVEKLVEKPLTKWQKFRLTGFWLLALGCAAALAYIFRKPLLSLIGKIPI